MSKDQKQRAPKYFNDHISSFVIMWWSIKCKSVLRFPIKKQIKYIKLKKAPNVQSRNM